MGTSEPHKQINQSLKQARSDILYNLGNLLFAVPHSYIQSFEADLNAYGNRHMVFFIIIFTNSLPSPALLSEIRGIRWKF